MVDEIHYIGNKSRGQIIESLITRMLMLKSLKELENQNVSNLRIVGISATLQNDK